MLFGLEAHVVVQDVALFQKHHGLLNLTRNVRQGRGSALENAAADFPEEKWMGFPFRVSYTKLNLTDGNS